MDHIDGADSLMQEIASIEVAVSKESTAWRHYVQYLDRQLMHLESEQPTMLQLCIKELSYGHHLPPRIDITGPLQMKIETLTQRAGKKKKRMREEIIEQELLATLFILNNINQP